MSQILGVLTKFADLSVEEQEVVLVACHGADCSADHELCFQSNFPVGAGILAANRKGESRLFGGCNVENDYFPATICAERNTGTTAAFAGYKQFKVVSTYCRKHPGGPPCGLCRQFLHQYGRDTVLLNIIDHDRNVRRLTVGETLPKAAASAVALAELDADMRRLVRRVLKLKTRCHVPYSKRPRGALFIASNDKGRQRIFEGVSDDNASYGGSALADAVAMRTARTAGFTKNVTLISACDNPAAVNPVDGECLQVLREFGADAPVWLVGPDGSAILSSLDELLPESFGPHSL